MTHQLKIFFDYVCPYCFIGKGIVDELKKEYQLDVEWVPFELHPETPLEGTRISQFFENSNIEYMYHVLNTAIKPYNLEFSGKDLMVNTNKALLATEYAKDQGRAEAFHAEVFKIYFTEGKNIADEAVLREVAVRTGLDPDEMMKKVEDGTYISRLTEAREEASYYEVRSTPTFILDDKLKIVGAQSLDVFRKALTESQAG